METLKNWFEAGGEMMWVILALSVIGWVVFVERVWTLWFTHRLATTPFINRVVTLVEQRRFREALDATNLKTKHPLVGVMRAGVLRADRRLKEIERGMERQMLDALPELGKRVGFLALLANAATLLGLLGTIFGLIKAFDSVKMAEAVQRQQELSNGISVAMYTTALGISVAVPLLFFHHFLSRRSEDIISDVERGATALVVALGGELGAPPDDADDGARASVPGAVPA
ncbi:MAG: MotA/TolQ/ExbB proton channel family protein [Myxococcales bacterium]|nr:MotA/TolQ/ExbB proton channel family protein [Myxococcales bacterium]MCB9735846.1 MotA/TolQ/ExbB proton channel family protein [Deltaproteobacteria bacterium]